MRFYTFFIFALVLFSTSTFAQVSVSSILHTAVPSENISKVTLHLEGEVEIVTTKSSRIMIETMVSADLQNQRLMDYLASSGRYGLEQEIHADTGEIIFRLKKRNNVLMVKGKECKEFFTHKVLIPESIQYVENEGFTASK